MRPLVMEFPDEPSVATLTSQWLDGDHLLVAPVLSNDNSTTVTFPESTLWYELNSTTTHTGPQNLQLHNVALNSVPVFARAGAVIPFGPVVQYSDQIGTSGYDSLDLHVYSGANGKFILFEDDGETYGYAQDSETAVRETLFNWDNAKRTLMWSVTGKYAGANIFKTVDIVAFFESSGTPVNSGPLNLGTSGSYTFK